MIDSPVQFKQSADYSLQFDSKLPARADVVVIGAGVIGVCTAYQLALSGLRVVLCEKGLVAGEQSSRNWGWIRQLGRDADELPIMMESIRLWEQMRQEIGEDVGFRQHGIIYLASTQKKLAARESWMRIAKAHDLDTRMITGAGVEKQINGASKQWCGIFISIFCIMKAIFLY